METKWFGFKFNLKWPHEGWCIGFSYDHYDETEDAPWASFIFRTFFLTIVYDYGFGDESKEIYNDQ
jgi:hypothetical protein|tara:strand:+ start:1951 stop:2148 length:198 start_codon:yes stop_codon:yes gene_type:complete